MANQSIYAGFERMWQHTSSAIGAKADKEEVVGVVYAKEDEGTDSSVPVNADTLGGRPADDYATQAFISNLDIIYAYDEDPETTVAPVDADTLGGRPASDFAVKDDLTAENVGARPNTWTPTAEEVGAIPVINYNNTGCYYRESGGVVEWINPPFDLNEEYRTIERYKRLPVYAKSVELDLSPSGSKHVWIASGITNVVSIEGCVSYIYDTKFEPIAVHNTTMSMNVYGNLVFNVTADQIAHIIVKYTK
jgi:hypothetical protein